MVTRILCPSHAPRSTHCPHWGKVLPPDKWLLQETQEKARVQGLYLLTKQEHHSKSKPKQQCHCCVFFLPMSKWEVMPIPGISGKEGKGVSTFKQRAGKRAGANADEGKVKIPQPLLVLLKSQTLHGAASFVLEEQSNICRWVSLALVTILHQRIKPTFQYVKTDESCPAKFSS